MTSSLPKYVRTDDSVLIFSNCINHADVFDHVYGYDRKPSGAGFVKACNNEDCGLQLMGEKHVTGIEDFADDCQDICKKTMLLGKNFKYITTASRFVIFSDKFSHKEIANDLMTGFFVQGAGYLTIEKTQDGVKFNCFGSSEELRIQAREIDCLIINDAFPQEKNKGI